MSLSPKFTRRTAVLLAAGAATALSAGSAFAADIKIGFLLKTMQEERYKRDRAAFTIRLSSGLRFGIVGSVGSR